MTGVAPSNSIIKEMVNDIRQDYVASINDDDIELISYQPFGKHWLDRFLKCHPKLIASFAHRIDAASVHESTEKQIKEWFIIVERVLKEFNIDPKNVYNMDESGHHIGVTQVPHTVHDSFCNVNYRKQGGRQEWVSVVECICADGSVINALLILKGEKISTNWLPETIPTQQ